MQVASSPHPPRDRLAAAFLLVLMAIGSFALWVGIPAAALYAASRLSDSIGSHLALGLPLSLASMVAFGAFLIWLNRLYLRITIPWAVAEAEADEDPRRLRGPLEPLLVGSLLVALIGFVVWFFVFAENPNTAAF